MERIIIHNLYKYKLLLGEEKEVDAVSSDKDNKSTKLGYGNKLMNILYYDPREGWTPVTSASLVFEIADANRYNLSKNLLKQLNPSESFMEARRKKTESQKDSRRGNNRRPNKRNQNNGQ